MIAEIQDLLGIRKSEIARALDVHPSSVGRTEAGIPALSGEYISRICAMLSINEDFLYESADYPFLPESFLIFKVRGLKNRLRHLGWLELLISCSTNLKVLLLLRRKRDSVVAVCVQDDRNSVFLISIEIPLSFKTVFEYVRKQPKEKVRIIAQEYFDSLDILSPHHSFSDIAHYQRDTIESMIEDAFASYPSEKQ
ncbi:MAG: helix-turn-helix domain-containing protein, partial [Euryarchaeota archaeon]|nr:helix-turn-helix domain-containing protein [Euryarchaeota archaeon]